MTGPFALALLGVFVAALVMCGLSQDALVCRYHDLEGRPRPPVLTRTSRGYLRQNREWLRPMWDGRSTDAALATHRRRMHRWLWVAAGAWVVIMVIAGYHLLGGAG
jgi:hypothetical protein